MPLISALLRDPSTPTPVVVAIADHVDLSVQDRAALLVHPALPAEHDALREVLPVRDLVEADRTGRVSAQRRQHLLRVGGARAALDYLSAHPDASTDDVRVVAGIVSAERGVPMPTALARRLVRHPGTPGDLRVPALKVLLRARRLRRREREPLISAALRQPGSVRELIAVTGDRYAARTMSAFVADDPDGAYGRWVEHWVRWARTSQMPAAWVAALRATEDVRVGHEVLARVEQTSTTEARTVLWNILGSCRLARETKNGVLRAIVGSQVRSAKDHWGQYGAAVRHSLRFAPADVLALAARRAAKEAELPTIEELTDCDAAMVADVWDATCRVSYQSLARRAAAMARVALSPYATAAMHAKAGDVVLDFGCSAEADRHSARVWFSPSVACQALNALQRSGPAAAGLSLDLGTVRRSPRHGLGGMVWHILTEALRKQHDALSDPATFSALLALQGGFDGTVGELLETAQAVTA